MDLITQGINVVGIKTNINTKREIPARDASTDDTSLETAERYPGISSLQFFGWNSNSIDREGSTTVNKRKDFAGIRMQNTLS